MAQMIGDVFQAAGAIRPEPTEIGVSYAVRELSPHIGAEVLGVDLNHPLSDEADRFVREAWTRYGVLLFRNPDHTDAAQLRLSRMFGELEPSAIKHLNSGESSYFFRLENDPSDPEGNANASYVYKGQTLAGWIGWHWDQAFMPKILRGACLRAVEPAAELGLTGLIDGIAAYDRLSDRMKARIEDLEVVYLFNIDYASGQFGYPEDLQLVPLTPKQRMLWDKMHSEFTETVHPMVITQPETGRKILKLCPMHARYILGMDRAESDELLQELAEHLCDERYAHWHDWEPGDLLIWDNWRIVHAASGVPPHVARRMLRTTFLGDYNLGRYLDPAMDREHVGLRVMD